MLNEFQFIETIRRKYSLNKIGDDCAILPKDAQTDLVITSDLLVEDIDFRLGWTKPEFIGHKSLAVSLSDIAAMGAKPVWSMLSVGIPERLWNSDFTEKFYDGYMKLAKIFDVELIGGDISKTPDKIVIDSTVAGEIEKGNAILRSGAQVGDFIFVTGELGGAAAGLKILENGSNVFSKSQTNPLLLRQLMPNSQTKLGQFLGERRIPSAMIDLSDGLSSDLVHLCRQSKVGAKIYADLLPFDENLNLLTETNEQKLDFVLNGGEDYELIFTVSPSEFHKIDDLTNQFKITKIGEIVDSADFLNLIVGDLGDQTSIKLEAKGFRHF